MRKVIFTALLFISAFCCYAQELVFINSTQNKVIPVRIGNKLHLAYKGYNNQLEYCANLVFAITDSTITLGSKSFNPNRKRLNHKTNHYKTIRIADIVAFRKRASGVEIMRNLLQIGAIVTSALLLSDLYAQNNSAGGALLLSLGTGLSINMAIKGLFPENAKYFIKDGWEIRYLSAP